MRKIFTVPVAVALLGSALLAASGAPAASKPAKAPTGGAACVQALEQAKHAFEQTQRSDRKTFEATHPTKAAREAFDAAQDAARQAFQAQQNAGKEACNQQRQLANQQRKACLEALKLTKKQFHQQQHTARKAFEATHPTEAAKHAFDETQQQERKAFKAQYKTQKKACQAIGH